MERQPEFMKSMDGYLPISEMFYSIQGEGPTMGCPSIFIRLQGCNLLCSWCDTTNVWVKGNNMSHEDIFSYWMRSGWMDLFKEYEIPHVIITGGEPMTRQKILIPFFQKLQSKIGYCPLIEIETNGTISPSNDFDEYITQYNVSPKLQNSGMAANRRIQDAVIKRYLDLISSLFQKKMKRGG